MKTLYQYRSYKSYLQDYIRAQDRGATTLLAKAAGCSRVYLSQVLSSKVQLLPDHAFGIADYLGLSASGQDFFLHLVLFERAKTAEVQGKIRTKLDKIIEDDLVLSRKIHKRGDSRELTFAQKERYYQSARHSLVHTLTSVREFQTVAKLSERARLSESETLAVLQDLVEMGLVKAREGKWVHTLESLHVPAGSSHYARNHLNWRLRCLEGLEKQKSIHYTTVFSLARADWEVLRADLIAFIENQREKIHASGAEEAFTFCCDLFSP